jgi:hypothetical protein
MMQAMEAKMAHVKANLKLRFFLGSTASGSSVEAIVVMLPCLFFVYCFRDSVGTRECYTTHVWSVGEDAYL